MGSTISAAVVRALADRIKSLADQLYGLVPEMEAHSGKVPGSVSKTPERIEREVTRMLTAVRVGLIKAETRPPKRRGKSAVEEPLGSPTPPKKRRKQPNDENSN